jgi:hypothetical protein
MSLLLDAHCNHRAHFNTVARIDRDGQHLAHRDEAARFLQAERDTVRPIRRRRGLTFVFVLGLRRLRLA